MNNLNANWKQFVNDQLSLGGGRLFRFISKLDKAFLSVSSDTHSASGDPELFLTEQSKKWSKFWHPDEETDIELAMEFNHFWRAAQEQSQDIVFDINSLDSALKGYRKETMGSDIWKPSELRMLPDIIKKQFARAIQSSLRAVAIPHQHLLSLNPLLGKPNKTCRTVCKTPVAYRMTLRANTSVREWEVENKQEYDTATVGSSALMAALRRNLRAELAFWLSEHFATILNDYEKYFDTLDLRVLMVEAIFTRFPLGPMAFSLQQHMAPRVLQANGMSSVPITVCRSILAGCKYSVPFTRVYALREYTQLAKQHKHANPELFVDDTSMHAKGGTTFEVEDTLLSAMAAFKQIVHNLKLRLSSKAAIVTSCRRLGKSLNAKLAKLGLKFVIAEHSRDLGVTTTAGKARPNHIQKQRQIKSKHRIFRISKIARLSRSARKLFQGSGFAVSTWGHQASAISDIKMRELESDALACTGIRSGGRCRTSALLVAYGVQGTPRARVVRETIRAYFELLRSMSSGEIMDIRAAWPIARQAIIDKKRHISSIHGIMSNVIYILLNAKWNPRAYNLWADSEGSLWQIVDWSVSADIVAAAITRSYFQIDLLRAAKHYNGKGIERGIDTTNTLRHIRNIKTKTIVNYQYKAALETIMSACSWPASRIKTLNPLYDDLCPRCGIAVETDFHAFWECRCNSDIDHEYVSKTQNLLEQARSNHEQYPAMWLRGILPRGFTDVPQPHNVPTSELNQQFINPESQPWDSGTYYGDASGGKHTAFKDIRRVGVAVVKCDQPGCTSFGISSNLPGPVQSVGRGGLFALLLLVRHLDHKTQVEFVTDNLNVHNIYNAGARAAVNSANCDLYKEIYSWVSYKQIQLEVRWMPSHLGLGVDDERPSDVTHFDVLANDQADHHARKAADLAQVPDCIATDHIYYIDLITKIQKQLAVILMSLPQRQAKKVEKEKAAPRVKLDDLLKETSHSLIFVDTRMRCTKCLSSFSINDPVSRHWLTTKCVHEVSADRHSQVLQSPIPINQPIHAGNQLTHSTHILKNYKGIIYCSKCGARSGKNQIRYLAKPCEPPTTTGLRTLALIANGLLPSGYTDWPN